MDQSALKCPIEAEVYSHCQRMLMYLNASRIWSADVSLVVDFLTGFNMGVSKNGGVPQK